ncbi:MAG: CHAT domain-containing tetratricopeptide repeat protein [Planctomycetota bacterium]
MPTPRALLFAVSIVAVGACRATHESGASRESEPLASSAESAQVDEPLEAPDAVARDWIAERWPELVHVEALADAQELDSARTALAEWMEPGLDARCDGLDVQDRSSVARRVDAIAASVSMLEAQLAARELRHRLLGATLPEEDADLLESELDLAATRYNLGDLDGALALEEHVLAVYERVLPSDHPDLLRAQLRLAATKYDLGDIESARALVARVHDVRERLLPPDHPDVLEAKQALAMVHRARGDLDAALALLLEVHGVMERRLTESDPERLNVEQNLAVTLSDLGDLDGALVLQEHVVAVMEQYLPADHPDLLGATSNLAWTRSRLGELEAALVLFEKVHSAYERLLPTDHVDLLGAKQNIASIRYALGDLEGALALFEYVFSARVRVLPPNHPDLLRVELNLAGTRKELGDLEGALALEERVHAVMERALPADHPDLLAAKHNLAGTRKELGDLEGAHALFEVVHDARERILPADHPDLLAAKQNLATTRLELGDLAGALELNEYVHAARERLLPEDHPDLLAAKLNLAATLEALGDLEGALALLEHVHAAWERLLPAEHPLLLMATLNLAATRSDAGDLPGALELVEQVRATWERILPADHASLLAARQLLAATRGRLGDLGGLHVAVTALLDAQLAVCTSIASYAPRPARAAALRELERLEWQTHWSEVLEVNAEADLTPRLVATLESLRSVSTASAEVARAMALVPELRSVGNSLARARRALADESQSGRSDGEAVDEWRLRLLALSESRDALERELRRQLGERGLDFELPTVPSIAAGIESGAAYVGYWRYRRLRQTSPGSREYATTDSLLAFVMMHDGVVHRVELGPAAELDVLVENWRTALGSPLEVRGLGVEAASEDGELEAGRALRAALLDPIVAVLDGSSPRTLHVVPDGLVHLVPLDALPNDDGSRVGEAIRIEIDPSVARLVRPRRDVASSGTLVAIGGVDYGTGDALDVEFADAVVPERSGGSSFDALPGARLEAQVTAELFERHVGGTATWLLGQEATEAALVEFAPRARYLHLATHGWFTPASVAVSMLDRDGEHDAATRHALERVEDTIAGFLPETLCGLALAGANHGVAGRLTAEELATLDLTDCELAVLSACETNVGIRRAGQGIQSLQTALHAAGARTAICSLWKVDDAATRRLFEVFYTKLWKDGLGKADALWQAKMVLKGEGHPLRDWAGWVLTGAPD